MSRAPEVSVLMPVYNAAPFLRPAVDSILHQSFPDFEFLIIDDGSLDTTAEIIESYNDSRIRFFRREHEGLVAQLNFGISECRAPLIARFDGDDIAHPDRLALQIAYLRDQPETGVISSAFESIDEDGNILATRHLPETDESIRAILPVHNAICHPSVTFRKNIVIAREGYRVTDYPAEDYGLWLRLLPYTRFYNLADPLVKRRLSAGGVSLSQQAQQRAKHYVLSMDFLDREWETVPDRRMQTEFAMARTEYYNGSMKNARKILFRLIIGSPLTPSYWRYFAPSCFGDGVWHLLRRCGVASAITDPLRRTRPGRGLVAP